MTFINQYIRLFGVPDTLVTDNGSCFVSKEFQEFLKILNILHVKTTPNHPQSNGILENRHRRIKNTIRTLSNKQTEWDELIPIIQLAWNNAPLHNEIYSSNQLVFGQPMNMPGQFFEKRSTLNYPPLQNDSISNIIQQITEFNSHSIMTTNNQQSNKMFKFKDMDKCESVFIEIENRKHKLEPLYKGPYPVIKRTDQYFIIDQNNKEIKVNIERIKPAYTIDEEEAGNDIQIVTYEPSQIIKMQQHKESMHKIRDLQTQLLKPLKLKKPKSDVKDRYSRPPMISTILYPKGLIKPDGTRVDIKK